MKGGEAVKRKKSYLAVAMCWMITLAVAHVEHAGKPYKPSYFWLSGIIYSLAVIAHVVLFFRSGKKESNG